MATARAAAAKRKAAAAIADSRVMMAAHKVKEGGPNDTSSVMVPPSFALFRCQNKLENKTGKYDFAAAAGSCVL